MMAVLEQLSRATCPMCNLQSNSTLCDACKSEAQEDFYLLLLTRFKDECADYFGLQVKCINMHDAIDHYRVPDIPVTVFDQSVHTVDEHANDLLEEYTMISTNEIIPVDVAGDGDCLFHTLRAFYPAMTIDELRARCLDELCSYEQYYETIKNEIGLDPVDDVPAQDHDLRIINANNRSKISVIREMSHSPFISSIVV